MVYELSRALNTQSAMMNYILNWIANNPIFRANKKEYGLILTPYEELHTGNSPIYIPESRVLVKPDDDIDIHCQDEVISLTVVGRFTV